MENETHLLIGFYTLEELTCQENYTWNETQKMSNLPTFPTLATL